MKTPEHYYHGTDSIAACSIMLFGFKVSNYCMHGRALGRGIYVTRNPVSTAHWGDCLITCELVRGTKIIWIQNDYDKKTIGYLAREFGKDLIKFRDNFEKVIPSNKNLTNDELMNLLSYYWDISHRRSKFKGGKKEFRRIDWIIETMARFDKLIRWAGFDAVGNRTQKHWDSDEIMFFNPSVLKPVSVRRIENLQEFNKAVNLDAVSPKGFVLRLSDCLSVEQLCETAFSEMLALDFCDGVTVSYKEGALIGIRDGYGDEIPCGVDLVLFNKLLAMYGPRKDGVFKMTSKGGCLNTTKLVGN